MKKVVLTLVVGLAATASAQTTPAAAAQTYGSAQCPKGKFWVATEHGGFCTDLSALAQPPSASQVQLGQALGEVTLCVDGPYISSLNKANVNDARDRLIKALIHQSSAKNKSTPIKVEALANRFSIKSSECRIILSTTLVKLSSRTMLVGGSPYGVGAPNQLWEVELRYHIYRANDHVTVAEETVTLTGGGAQDVVNAALSSVAKDVVKRLREKPRS